MNEPRTFDVKVIWLPTVCYMIMLALMIFAFVPILIIVIFTSLVAYFTIPIPFFSHARVCEGYFTHPSVMLRGRKFEYRFVASCGEARGFPRMFGYNVCVRFNNKDKKHGRWVCINLKDPQGFIAAINAKLGGDTATAGGDAL